MKKKEKKEKAMLSVTQKVTASLCSVVSFTYSNTCLFWKQSWESVAVLWKGKLIKVRFLQLTSLVLCDNLLLKHTSITKQSPGVYENDNKSLAFKYLVYWNHHMKNYESLGVSQHFKT